MRVMGDPAGLEETGWLAHLQGGAGFLNVTTVEVLVNQGIHLRSTAPLISNW